MRIKAVLFDLFDTLLLVNGGDAFYEPALKRLHFSLFENGFEVSFEEFKRTYFEVRDRLYVETQKSLEEPHFTVRIAQTLRNLGYNVDPANQAMVDGARVFAEEFAKYVRPDEDAADVLPRLYGEYRLGIVSNLAIPEYAHVLLDKYDLATFFDVILVSGAVNKRKPAPEIFERALREIGVEASQAVFVGDTPSMDVKGAKNVGMKAILIERKVFATDQTRLSTWKPADSNVRFEPDSVIKRLKELPSVLKDC
jgi:HAD superfamily hydrolase (TIGR01549 family)